MKENYEKYLRMAKETLDRIDYLIPDDRKILKRGIFDIEYGLDLLASDDPIQLRAAASLLTIGAANIWSICGASNSAAEYRRRLRCGKGGAKTNPDTAEWQRWVLEKMAKYPDVKPVAMTNSLLAEKAKPSNLPGYEHLLRFVRDSRKLEQAKIRLVHSA